MGERVVDLSILPFIRAQIITVSATGLKPNTRVYAFFDKKDVNAYVTPSSTTYTSDTTVAAASPLITTSSGSKMGKTANGAIWLNSNLCSPWDYWQFWRNTEDKDVIRFLKLFTEISLEEIRKLEKLEGAEINDAKIILANAATTLLHGEEETKKAISTAKNIFEKKEM